MTKIDIDDAQTVDEIIDAIEKNPSPMNYEYYKCLRDREIWIENVVDEEEGTMDIVKKIISWNREDKGKPVKERKPIILYLFSFGGDSDICRSIIDAIRASETPVYAVNAGRCMSAAAYIYIACHKRFMFKRSYFLFHQGSASFSGDFDKLDAWFEDYKHAVDELSDIMKEFTKYSDEDIEKNITTEWYVHADEALANGVADKVIESLDEVIL